MIAAIFDLDGTFSSGRMWKGVWIYHHRNHKNLLPLYAYVFVHMIPWPFYRVGLISQERFYMMWGKHLSWTVMGMTHEQLKEMSRWLTEEYFAPRVRPEMLERLQWHRDCGHRTMLLSGSYRNLVKTVARHYGFDGFAGTWLAKRMKWYTGGTESPVCQGRGKVECLDRFLMAQGWDIDLGRSYAYADSETDRFLLEKVGHPVAVYPTPELRKIAVARGWEIIPPSAGD